MAICTGMDGKDAIHWRVILVASWRTDRILVEKVKKEDEERIVVTVFLHF